MDRHQIQTFVNNNYKIQTMIEMNNNKQSTEEYQRENPIKKFVVPNQETDDDCCICYEILNIQNNDKVIQAMSDLQNIYS